MSNSGWSEAERQAMKARAEELTAEKGRGSAARAKQAQALLDAIAEMPDADRAIAERLHSIVTKTAPQLGEVDPVEWTS